MTSGAGGDTCLITGSTGFVGSHVARRLAAEGYRVRCLIRATSDVSRLEPFAPELIVGDLTSRQSLRAAADGCRFVVHCGALVSDWARVSEIRQINVIGTRHLLEASVAASVERFVHLSTTDVYCYPGGHEVEEDQPPGRFSNWYSETKREAEAEVRRQAQGSALEAVILRPATVYGPHSTEVVGEMAKALRGRHMLLIDRGKAVAGLSYVENVVDAVVLAVREDAARGEAFNVTDGLDVTWAQFLGDLAGALGFPPPRLGLPYGAARAIATALEQGYRALTATTRLTTPPLLSRQAVDVLGRDQDFSNRKLRTRLGWEPRVGYRDGLEATVNWLREDYLTRRG